MNTDSRASHLAGANHSVNVCNTTGANAADARLPPDQHWLDSWFVRMVTYCKVGRLLNVETAPSQWMLRELKRRGFTKSQSERAEIWIVGGDWGVKGARHTLAIQDFWPTDRQLQSCQCELFPSSALKVAYEQGRSFERDKATNQSRIASPTTPSEEVATLRVLQRENLMEILQLKSELAEAKDTLSRMQSENDRLLKRIDKLQNAAAAEVNEHR